MQCLNDVRDFKYVYTLLVSMAQYTRRADTDRRNMLKYVLSNGNEYI